MVKQIHLNSDSFKLKIAQVAQAQNPEDEYSKQSQDDFNLILLILLPAANFFLRIVRKSLNEVSCWVSYTPPIAVPRPVGTVVNLYNLYFVVGAADVSSVEKYILAEPTWLPEYPAEDEP